jgi:hypothetical protein
MGTWGAYPLKTAVSGPWAVGYLALLVWAGAALAGGLTQVCPCL